jgi:hypothetical protein
MRLSWELISHTTIKAPLLSPYFETSYNYYTLYFVVHESNIVEESDRQAAVQMVML